MTTPFHKVLVANRGEVAVRVIRALREEGISPVAVFSEADRDALHVRFADQAYCIGPPPSAESYLNQESILDAARRSGADAIHPGYGFLSENAQFARTCGEAKFTFIGPSPETMTRMGDKLAARNTAATAGVPVVPGSPGPVEKPREAAKIAETIGFPVMIKAKAGGGGKGMRVVENKADLEPALELTHSEAKNAFGDGTLYLEKFIERPRHVEIQILGDAKGNVIHLGERECSLQRRHQKVLEEAPSPWITVDRRREIGEAAVKLARVVGYQNAGTVEFLVAPSGEFYFMEMNTRLQVEHPVTELVYGVDIVREQIRLAEGRDLSWKQEELSPKGWAIECRIYAEDPYNHFLPSLGTINRLRLGSGPGVRNDSGIFQGYEVPRYYDPMLGKLIVHGEDRETARKRMIRALREMLVEGVQTNISFHRWVLNRKEFIDGGVDTGFIERVFRGMERSKDSDRAQAAIVAAVIETYEEDHRFQPPASENVDVSPWALLGRPGTVKKERL